MIVEIVEVLRRSTQGVTEPFICRGADDHLYFVKGRAAGRGSLIREWISGRLAEALELPIAPFSIMDVPYELLDQTSDMRLSDLGPGPAFGSQQREYTRDIQFSQISEIPQQTRMDILVFDRWIRNYDRTLSPLGGNPNLLWAADSNSVVMIDHNNAFDQTMSGQAFASVHMFGDDYLSICHDATLVTAYREALDGALSGWDAIVSSVPQAWLFLDENETLPTNFNFDGAFEVLCRHREEEFWSW